MNYSNTILHIITFTITLMLTLSFSTQQETHSSSLIDEKMKRIALLKKSLLEIEKFSKIKTSEKDCLLSKEILSRREYITTYDIFNNDLTINFCLYVFVFLAVVSYVIYVFNTKFPVDYMNKQEEDFNNEEKNMKKPVQKSKCKMNMSQTYLFNENTILNFENENENEHDNEKDLKNKLQIGNYIIEKSNNEETYEEINDFKYILDSL